jgi:hypothetical protein
LAFAAGLVCMRRRSCRRRASLREPAVCRGSCPRPTKVIARTGRPALCRGFRRRCLATADTASLYGAHVRPALRVRRRKTLNGVLLAGPGRNSRSSPALGRAQDEDRRPSTLHEPRHAMSGISPLRTLTRQPVPVGRSELGRRLEAMLAVWAMAASMHGGDTTGVGGEDTWHTEGIGMERDGWRTSLVCGWSLWSHLLRRAVGHRREEAHEELPRRFLTRGRNVYPRNSNPSLGCRPVRSPSLQ